MEALYHYLWKNGLFGRTFTSSQGVQVEVLNPGKHNNDAGPDFYGANLSIDGINWIGNVEIHVKASDWRRHGHDTNPAYNSVILHVVGVDDEEIERSSGQPITQICVAPPAEFFKRYASITDNIDKPGCLNWLPNFPSLNKTDWIATLGIERLQEKGSYMKHILNDNNGDWQQTLFIITARALGFGLNGVPFEILAKNLPLNFVMRHQDDITQIEALVFGQAGMLNPTEYTYDDYYQLLCREYSFLAQKYSLTPMKREIWKYSRTRPQNFPHRRIAILCAMLARGMSFFGMLTEARGDYETLLAALEFEASDYWQWHSGFGQKRSDIPFSRSLTRKSRDIIIINAMAPFYYAYGSLTGNYDQAEKGVDLLNEINAERNSIIDMWKLGGIYAKNAFDSQALIHLKRNYCEKTRCLECRFGHLLLRGACTTRPI